MNTKELKIPTILGLGIIIAGLVAGVFLVSQQKTFLTKAAPSLAPKDIPVVTNIEDQSVVISWQTSGATTGFVTYGQNSPEGLSAHDDRDKAAPELRSSVHYVTIKNLLPKTTYQYRVVSGALISNTFKFTTAVPASSSNGFRPLIGNVTENNQPLKEGLAYLSIPGAVVQAALVKNNGNFLIPLSSIRTGNLTDVFSLTEGTNAKLTILSDSGKADVSFQIKPGDQDIPTIKIGDILDLTDHTEFKAQTEVPLSSDDIQKYDFNADKQVNAPDYSTILNNFGPNPQDKRTDLNRDGVVDEKDLELISTHINQ